MWESEPEWAQQGSYVEPVAPPSTLVTDAPQICIPVNESWIPYICGALKQLAQPSSWNMVGAPMTIEELLGRVTDLIGIAGNASACVSGPTNVEQLWITDQGGGVIHRTQLGTPHVGQSICIGPGGGTPTGTAKGNGHYWLFYEGATFVYQVDIGGFYVDNSISTALPWFHGIDSGADMLITDYTSAEVRRYSYAAAHLNTYTHAGMITPLYIAQDINGRYWVTNYTNSPAVFIFNSDMTFYGTYTPAGSFQVRGIDRVDWGGNSYMWIADYAQNRIYEVTPGLVLNRTISTAGLTAPTAICPIGSSVYVGLAGALIKVVTPSSGAIASSIAVTGCSFLSHILHIPASP